MSSLFTHAIVQLCCTEFNVLPCASHSATPCHILRHEEPNGAMHAENRYSSSYIHVHLAGDRPAMGSVIPGGMYCGDRLTRVPALN